MMLQNINNPLYDAQKGLVFLDTAASSLKPKVVIDSVNDYYTKLGVNVHRGVYSLSIKQQNSMNKQELVLRNS